MKERLSFTVKTESALLPFLRDCFPAKSRNYVKGLLSRGQVYVDGSAQTHYALPLHAGQVVNIWPAAADTGAAMGFPVIYEDDDIIVIDKPHGMLSIAIDTERENTAYHIVTSYVKSLDSSNRIFIVHRLDRDTSGIMLFAKTEAMKSMLQEDWDSLAVHRGYIAVVEGSPEESEGQIVSWLKQTKTLLVYSSRQKGDGKKAITNYRTIQGNRAYSLMDISLETGRKNQIRVHMSELGHPVAGDKKYRAKTNPLGRLGLHAVSLSVTNPVSGEEMRFESKIPSEFLGITEPEKD